MASRLNVCTYNVLSSALFDDSRLSRYNVLQARLDGMIKDNTVIMLQEVSQEWAGHLVAFFASRHYRFIHRLYGSSKNGWMGVGIALHESISIETVRFQTISAYGEWEEQTPSWPKWITALWATDEVDERAIALKPANVAIFLRLYMGGKSVCVATYHMPCKFLYPVVMAYHLSTLVRWVQYQAGSSPYILGGDFNIQPTAPLYSFARTGMLDDGDLKRDIDQRFPMSNASMRSAYNTMYAEEPPSTNHAIARDGSVFSATLDYIFYSGGIALFEIPLIPPLEEILPSKKEPSDHIPVRATFTL